MKRMLSLVFVVLMVLSSLPAMAAETVGGVLISNTFDSVATYEKPGGWTINNNGNPAYVVETEEGVNKALMLECKTSEIVMDYALSSAPVNMVSEADIRVDSCGAEFKVFLQKDGTNAFNNFLSFYPDGTIMAMDGRKLGNWAPEEWYHIVLTQNSKTHRNSISINGKRCISDALYDNTSFGTPTVFRFQLGASIEGTKVYLDNVRVYDGSAGLTEADFPRETYNPESGEAPSETPVQQEQKVTDTVYALQNFNSDETGAQPEMWNVEQKDGQIYIDEVPSSKDKSVCIEQVSQDPLMDLMLTPDSTDIVVEAKVRAEDMNVVKQVFTMRSSTGQFAAVFKFGTDGYITAAGKQLTKYMRKRWYELGAAIHLTSKTMDIYLGGELMMENVPFDNAAFTTPERFRIQANSGPGSKFYVDNIRVYAGTAPKDPSTLKMTEESGELVKNSIFSTDQAAIDKVTGSVAVIENHGYGFDGTQKRELDAPPFVENGRTMIPVRFVSEGLGGQVDWAEETKTVTIVLEGRTIRMTVGTPEIEVDGVKTAIDAAPVQVGARTYVPLRALAEQGLGQKVAWYEKGSMAVVGDAAERSDSDLQEIYQYMLYTRPKEQTFLDNLNNVHPRVMATQEDFDQIRTGVQSEPMKSWAEETIAVADSLIEREVLTYVKPDGLRLLDTSREMLSRMTNLGMAYQITGDKKYADRAWKDLQTVGKFRDWNHQNHYLDTAEMTAAVAIGYDWMYDCWTEDQKEFIEKAIVKHGLNQGVKCYNGQPGVNGSWVTWDWNWNAVCNGGMAVGALAVLDKEPELGSYILEQGLRSLEYMLPEFAPDGAWKEGPGYWQYTVQYLVYYMSTLQTANGTDYGYLALHNVDKTAYFPIYGSSAQGSFNIGDAGAGLVNAPEIFYFAGQLQDGGLARMRLNQMEDYGWKGSKFDLLFFDPACVVDDVNLPLDHYFGYTEVASFRSAWDDKNATFAAIHGGQNNVAHGNLDSGTFVLDMEGTRWAVDLGADDYNLPGYFGMDGPNSQRWNYYRCRGEGQNTVVIDPGQGADQVYDAFTTIETFETKDRGGFAIVDMTPALANGAKEAKRGLKLDNSRRRVVLQDEISLQSGTHDLWWFMHTQSEITIAEDGKSAILIKGGQQLYVGLECSDESAVFAAMDAVPLPGSSTQEGQNTNSGTRKLALNLPKAKGDVTITVTFLPYIPGTPIENAQMVPMSEWQIPDGGLAQPPRAASIAVDGVELEDFDPALTSYSITLPYEAELPVISADAGANEVEITQVEEWGNTAYVKVTDAQDAGNYTYYSIHIRRLPKLDAGELGIFKVTASDEPQPENNKDNVVDGDFNTRWSADGNGVWLQLDLGEVKNVEVLGVAFYLGDQRFSYYDVQVSEDGETFEDVTSVASSGATLDYEYTEIGRKARYIRIVGNGTSEGTWFSVTEVKVLGE